MRIIPRFIPGSSTERKLLDDQKLFPGRLTVGRLPLEEKVLGSNPSPGALKKDLNGRFFICKNLVNRTA